MFDSPKRLLQCVVLVAVFLLIEVNAFFLKYVLWIPPLNPLNTYRLILLFLLGIPAVREYYIFIESNEVCTSTAMPAMPKVLTSSQMQLTAYLDCSLM